MSPSSTPPTRREFLKQSSAALVALSSLSAASRAFSAEETVKPTSSKKLRLALVGTGNRGLFTWGRPLAKDFSDRVEMVGLCDINPKRVAFAQTLFSTKVPAYTDFDKMIEETKPDKVIVATVDVYHAQYVIRAMELGCDVICEKPFAVTAKQCQDIHNAQQQLERDIIVTFNCRYYPEKMKVKELVKAGEIGELYSVDYAELLNLGHGADYFRRWHGIKYNSGTLLVHKACHHFDEINWWVESDPREVMAFGELRKYGHNGPFRFVHCRGCPHKKQCEFYWDITRSKYDMDLYVAAEDEDGYYRDGCLYRNEIDIYDTMSVQGTFENGVVLSYSLNATSPIEGQFIALNGSKGRIELRVYDRQPWKPDQSPELRLIKNYSSQASLIPIQRQVGGHGGADPAIREHIFKTELPDPLDQRAGSRAGIMSAIIGIAARTAIECGQPVKIGDLVNLE